MSLSMDVHSSLGDATPEDGAAAHMRDLEVQGFNSGPLVAGVIGNTKSQYDIWGDTVNSASRTESHGVPGKIQITEATYDLIKDDFVRTSRGPVTVKGKGAMVTWFLEGAR